MGVRAIIGSMEDEAVEPEHDVASILAKVASRELADMPSLKVLQQAYIYYVVKVCGGNLSQVAKVLGVDRRTVYRMVTRAGIDTAKLRERAKP